jgi:exoribonuclease R
MKQLSSAFWCVSAAETLQHLETTKTGLSSDEARQRLARYLETIEARPVFDGDELKDLEVERKNRAKEIIEDFMISANGVTARYLASKMFPSLRRVVRTPKRGVRKGQCWFQAVTTEMAPACIRVFGLY